MEVGDDLLQHVSSIKQHELTPSVVGFKVSAANNHPTFVCDNYNRRNSNIVFVVILLRNFFLLVHFDMLSFLHCLVQWVQMFTCLDLKRKGGNRLSNMGYIYQSINIVPNIQF